MAEINSNPQKQRHQRTACTKKSTRVDLTPMVDLGFLLLTFFVFSSALSHPTAMNLLLPNDKDPLTKDLLCESCTLTVLLDKDNQIWYYEGNENYAIDKATNYSPAGIRSLIQQKKKSLSAGQAGVIQKRGYFPFVLIIKPAPHSKFKNLIDVVDECSINMVKRYYVDELNESDKNWLKRNSTL